MGLSDELKMKLYMTSDDVNLNLGDGEDAKDIRSQGDPTFGMTAAQKIRYEKRMNAKPRPRDLFDVHGLMKQRTNKILERKQKQ